MYNLNPLMNCDSYKLGHMAQYPKGTELVVSNFTPRSDSHSTIPSEYRNGKVIFVGLTATLDEMNKVWKENFFNLSPAKMEEMVVAFGKRIAPFVGPTGFDLDKVRELYWYGKLPIEVRALPEGSSVNIGVPVFTVFNTDKRFYWITNYLETWLSCESWKITNSATIADAYRRILTDAAEKTGAPKEFVAWQAHDFSMRGMSGVNDAAKSGAGHLFVGLGTDNLPAILFMEQFYDGASTFIGGSVPATEHSVMCMGGIEDELETFRRLIEDIYPAGIVSIVSDTWDFWKVLTEYAPALKDKILARKPDALGFAKVVFRPDSGDPVKIICGDIMAEPGSPEYKGAVEVLWEIFGGTTTDKGYKVLDQRVGLIYGDSITPERAMRIMEGLGEKGFASCNTVLGVGSYTYQYNTRDTFGFAMKATYGVVNGEGRALFKDPKTDSGTKKSAKGYLRVEKNGKDFILVDGLDFGVDTGELKTVFREGEFLVRDSLEVIRARIANG